MNKQERRQHVLSVVEGLSSKIEGIRQAARGFINELPEEWVVRRRIVRQKISHAGSGPPVGHVSYWGVQNPGTRFYREGFIFQNPSSDGVKVSKSPLTAQLLAQHAADWDRQYTEQDNYVVEIIDRVDGEVLMVIGSRSDYIRLVDSGVTDPQLLRESLR